MIIAIIGTTISPWMQFYIQAAIVNKGVREADYAYSRLDVVAGGIWTDVVAYFIIVSCAATIFVHNLHAAHPIVVRDVGDVAVALQPIAGKFAALLFAVGLLNAAVFTASILPLSTAYYVCEAFGFERGVDHHFSEAPIFYSLYLALIVIGAGAVILPGAPLLTIIFYSQVLNGMLLPVVLVLMLLLINNKRLMGRWTNGPAFNVDRLGDGRHRRRTDARLDGAAHFPLARVLGASRETTAGRPPARASAFSYAAARAPRCRRDRRARRRSPARAR